MTANLQPGERRPLATRETNLAKRLSSVLVRLGFSPNGISVAGLIAGVGAGVAFAMTAGHPDNQRWLWLLGGILVQLRLLANMLDGMVAVEGGKVSAVGELYNEIPDRLSDTGTLVGVGFAAGSDPLLGMGAALVAVLVAYIRAQGKVAGGNQEFCGPMAKPQRMFLVTVLALVCTVAPERVIPTTSSEAAWSAPVIVLWVIIVGGLITAVRRILRIARTLSSR